MKLALSIILLLLCSCTVEYRVSNGKVRTHYQPGIVFRTDTAILFNATNEPLIEAEFDVEGAGHTTDTE